MLLVTSTDTTPPYMHTPGAGAVGKGACESLLEVGPELAGILDVEEVAEDVGVHLLGG